MKVIERIDFKNKQLAFYLYSVEPRDEAIAKYVKQIMEEYPEAKPVTFEVFAGKVKFLGRTTVDKRDVEEAEAWAEELGSKLAE